MPRRYVDLIFPVIGRICKASGAPTTREHHRRKSILRELYEQGHWEVLEALRDDRLRIPDVVAAYRADRLAFLLTDALLERPLDAIVSAWLPETWQPVQSTVQRYRTSWAAFQRACPTVRTVGDLTRVDWAAVRRDWPGGKHDWKHLRGFVSRLLSRVLGVTHPVRQVVLTAMPTAKALSRIPDLTPEGFWRIVARLPAHTQPIPVALVVTGMRVGELAACQDTDLRPLTHSIRVPGTKTEASEDVIPVDPALWPWIVRAVPLPVGLDYFRRLWRTAREGIADVTLHDLRHCHGQWLVQAGRPEAAVQGGLRHTSPDMTRRYTLHEGRVENARVIGTILTPTPTTTPAQREGASA